jgi:chromosome segregation ATPase
VERKAAEHDDNIAKLEEKKEGLRSETVSLEQKNRDADRKVSTLNSDVNSASKELMRNQDLFKQLQVKTDTAKKELEKTEKAIADLQQEIDTTRTSNEKEFQDRRTRLEDAQRKIRELAEKEPVADFLLTEATSEPPEISIVAKLIKENGFAPIDDLKRSTKVPPALAVKTVNSLEQKGILEKTSSNEVKLVKPY